MGSIERKEKEKEIRRNDIIEAAERVFFSKGYDKATMDDVAKEAEYSKRTVYVYFESKEQIYFHIMIRGFKRLIVMIRESMPPEKPGDALEAIMNLASIMYQFSKDCPQYFKAIMEYENGELDFQENISDDLIKECYALGEQALDYLIQALKRGMDEGLIRRDLDLIQTTCILWSCLVGILNTTRKKANYIMSFHHITPDDLFAASCRLILDSIRA